MLSNMRNYSTSPNDDNYSFGVGSRKPAATFGSGRANEDKNILSNSKDYLDDEDLSFNKKKETSVKKTTSLYPQNTIKPNSRQDKKANEVDDILKLIDDANDGTQKKPPVYQKPKPDLNDPFNNLLDDIDDGRSAPVFSNQGTVR
jgi:hypothetical protein